MKQITWSFAVVLSFALILASLPPSALANGMTAVGKTGVPQPVVAMPGNLNPNSVFGDASTMPQDLVTLENALPEISILPMSVPTADKALITTPDAVVTVEAKNVGSQVQADLLPGEIKTTTPVKSKTMRGWFGNILGKLGGGKVNWDNAAQRPEFNESPAASINKETQPRLLQTADVPSKGRAVGTKLPAPGSIGDEVLEKQEVRRRFNKLMNSDFGDLDDIDALKMIFMQTRSLEVQELVLQRIMEHVSKSWRYLRDIPYFESVLVRVEQMVNSDPNVRLKAMAIDLLQREGQTHWGRYEMFVFDRIERIAAHSSDKQIKEAATDVMLKVLDRYALPDTYTKHVQRKIHNIRLTEIPLIGGLLYRASSVLEQTSQRISRDWPEFRWRMGIHLQNLSDIATIIAVLGTATILFPPAIPLAILVLLVMMSFPL